MPQHSFTLRCKNGHDNGCLDEWAAREWAEQKPLCDRCGLVLRVTQFRPLATGFQVIPDIHEHYNITIDQPVRSRRHLRDLQKRSQEDPQKAFQDYDRVSG